MADALGLSHHSRICWGLGLVTRSSVTGGVSVGKVFDVVADRVGGQASFLSREPSNEAVQKNQSLTERGNDLEVASPSPL